MVAKVPWILNAIGIVIIIVLVVVIIIVSNSQSCSSGAACPEFYFVKETDSQVNITVSNYAFYVFLGTLNARNGAAATLSGSDVGTTFVIYNGPGASVTFTGMTITDSNGQSITGLTSDNSMLVAIVTGANTATGTVYLTSS